ncbi:lipase family protein [Corynebacterium minutissimum]|uniref:Secretory lipase n=1 Tax=Corynebacterium minutissimum TaxID=38301 RepID=A0A376CWQ9_9CORY|nr:lipase family protein [Corynebacterium minutissimum]STC77046.1 Secretory lipase [Corynebacterium minutissimum]
MKSSLPILTVACLVAASSPVALAQEVAPELPESALAEEALKDPVATKSPEESGDIEDAAEELRNYSTAPEPGMNNPVGDEYSAFYHDSVDVESSAPGQLFRSEPVRNPSNTLGITNIGPYKAQRILYSSTNRTGKKTAVSGIVIEPKAAWVRPGPRPVVAFAPGTQGVADRCAPSRKIAEGVGDYEQFFFEQYLKKGYAVVVTDYEGLGTPGMHTYMDRISQAHAVLDSARAAQQLSGWDIAADNPVFINGYSQGGGAAASAAELYDDYAPELNVKLATIGAAPADLTLLPPALDGTLYFLFESYALLGLSDSYGEDLYSHLNEKGAEILKRATNTCTLGLTSFAGTTIEQISNEEKDVDQFIASAPYDRILADQHIGYDAPSIPVVVTHGRGDDVIPFSTAEQLVNQWTSRGANVTFIPNDARSHVAGTVPHITESVKAIEAVLS